MKKHTSKSRTAVLAGALLRKSHRHIGTAKDQRYARQSAKREMHRFIGRPFSQRDALSPVRSVEAIAFIAV